MEVLKHNHLHNFSTKGKACSRCNKIVISARKEYSIVYITIAAITTRLEFREQLLHFPKNCLQMFLEFDKDHCHHFKKISALPSC